MKTIGKISVVLVLALGCSASVKPEKSPDASPTNKWPMPVFTAFEDMAIDAVIRLAPSHITKRTYMGDGQVGLDFANTAARFAFYDTHLGPKAGARMYAAQMGEWHAKHDGVPHQPELYDVWRSKAIDLARAALNDPADLERIYRRHRATVLQTIKESGLGPRTKVYLTQIASLFDGNPPNAELAVAKKDYEKSEKASDAAYDKYTTAEKAVTATSKKALDKLRDEWLAVSATKEKARHRYQGWWEDENEKQPKVWHDTLWREFEWAERRRAEGGDALVRAWGKVFADVANSL